MTRLIVLFAALIVLVAAAFPFARDAYLRNRVVTKLDPVMTAEDHAAFRAWQGDAVSFAKSLYARCELTHGQDAAPCQPYRLALE
jgi:hypothetical protein